MSCQHHPSCLQPVCKRFLTSGKTGNPVFALPTLIMKDSMGIGQLPPLLSITSKQLQGYPIGKLWIQNKYCRRNSDSSEPIKGYLKNHSMGKAVDEFERLFRVSGKNRVWVQTEEVNQSTRPDWDFLTLNHEDGLNLACFRKKSAVTKWPLREVKDTHQTEEGISKRNVYHDCFWIVLPVT